nr:MAG TPA: portal protein [Caudoviricetes sp.]
MITKTYDSYGNITKFVQSSFLSGQTIEYEPWQIAYFIYDKALQNENDGRSILTGMMYDVLNDLSAVRSNYYYYKNSSVPSALLLLNDAMTDEEIQNAKDQFEAQYKGLENSHKMLIGAGVSDIKTLSFSPRDMDTVAQRKITTEKVAAAF